MTHRTRVLLTAAVVAAATLALVAPPASAARPVADPGFAVQFDSAWGLRTATFVTPEGTIAVFLPATLALGDAYTMTFQLSPRGEGADLGRYVLALGADRAAASEGLLRGRVGEGAETVALRLESLGGEKLAEAQVPLLHRALPAPAEVRLPKTGHVGDPLVVAGPFDGDVTTTEVRVGGQKLALLAESPRDVVALSPNDLVGVAEMSLAENGVEAHAAYRSLRIEVEAPSGELAQGERRTLGVKVSGLAGLDEEILLLAINRTPEIVAIDGASAGLLNHRVRPADVAPDGTHSFEVDLTGRNGGEFEVLVAAATAEEPIATHTENVTPAPHYPLVTSPDHVTNETWPPYHADNVTFPPHTTNVTWPAGHVANLTWPKHVRNLTVWQLPTDTEETPEGEASPDETTGGLQVSRP